MSEKTIEHLAALGAHLTARRDAILSAWRRAANADVEQTTVNSLTRAQFNDHIPQLLSAFEFKLRARPGGRHADAADLAKTQEDMKHGLQRWQQGYRLGELMREWGHLHLCLFEEIESFFSAHPEIDRETRAAAQREVIDLINEGINQSADQYARLQQSEAAGHVRDLQRALAEVTAIEERRAQTIHQAVHDLRGNAWAVSSAADVLGESNIGEGARMTFASLVQRGVESLSVMLGDLMELARLEAGQEVREIEPFDAAAVLLNLCTLTRPLATERGLFLEMEGPESLKAEGDAGKVRRTLQNLILNALKYTEHGGVTVSWGEEEESWWVIVCDTGPGLMAGPAASIAEGLEEATAVARESDQNQVHATEEESAVLPPAPGGSGPAQRPDGREAGEGVGLSIVKRLCELLDASLELATSPESGTTFRVVFPRRYHATH